jgi:hypothetical protein
VTGMCAILPVHFISILSSKEVVKCEH